MLVWLQITLACVTLLAAVFVLAASRRVSVSLRLTKRINDLDVTMSDLQSTFVSLLESHKRLRSRAGMREIRDRDSEPVVEDKKTARRRIFGAAAGPAFAALQQKIASGDS